MSALGGGYRWCLRKSSGAAGCELEHCVEGTALGRASRGEGGSSRLLKTGRNVPPGPRCFPPGGRHREGLWQAPLNAELPAEVQLHVWIRGMRIQPQGLLRS